MLKQLLAILMLAVALLTAPAIASAQPPKDDQQEEFIPIDQLPPQEQLAAGPLLVGAYVFVPLVLFLYLFMLSKRLASVQREVDRLETDLKRTGRA